MNNDIHCCYSQLCVCEDMIQFPQYCPVLDVYTGYILLFIIFVRNTQFYDYNNYALKICI